MIVVGERYVQPICLKCGRLDVDYLKTVCECGGIVPLIHAPKTEEGARKIQERADHLVAHPEIRVRLNDDPVAMFNYQHEEVK